MKVDTQNTDPSYWENILVKSGCLSTEEEEQGIGLGIGIAVESFSEDPVEQQIADQLAKENPDIKYLGSPNSLDCLIAEIRHSLDVLKRPDAELGVGVHESCINGEDTIIVFRKGSLQHRFNTHATIDYTRLRLQELLEKEFKLELIEK